MKCTRCGRRLKNQPASGMGPVCERAVLGSKPRQLKRQDRRSADERQIALEFTNIAIGVTRG